MRKHVALTMNHDEHSDIGMGTSDRKSKSRLIMYYAFYMHGKRFLALLMDGIPNTNLARKHTCMMIMFEVVCKEDAQ